MFTPDDPGFDVPTVLEPSKPTRRVGPCGEIPEAPKPRFRPNELLVKLNTEAVTQDGFSAQAIRVIQMLQSQGALRIESLRSAWPVTHSISTGGVGVNWQVTFMNGPKSSQVTAQVLKVDKVVAPFWIGDLPQGSSEGEKSKGDGRWVGAHPDHGQTVRPSASPGRYLYSLDLAKHVKGKRGFFSFFWAGDNNVTWQVSNGTIKGQTSGNDAYGTLRLVTGTFQENCTLTAILENTTTENSPSGLIVIGTAGVYPEPQTAKPTMPLPGQFPDFPKATNRLLVGSTSDNQPPISLIEGPPGLPPAIRRPMLAPYVPHIQEELRYLYVYLDREPSSELISCLQLSPAVQFAERMPIVKPSGGGSGSPPVSPLLQTLKIAVNWTLPTPLQNPERISNLAILDDLFDYQPQHGARVWAVAYECLFGKIDANNQLHTWSVTNKGFMNTSEYHPSLYFSALRDVRVEEPKFPLYRVINLSRGSDDWTRMEMLEMKEMENREKSIVVVAAGGQNSPGYMVEYPAAYPTVVSVGGVTKEGQNWVPWRDMHCSYDADKLRCLQKKPHGYAIDVVAPATDFTIFGISSAGTSFGSPIVAALCSAILEKHPELSAADVRDAIGYKAVPIDAVKRRADDKEPNVWCGRGMIRWDQAFKKAAELASKSTKTS